MVMYLDKELALRSNDAPGRQFVMGAAPRPDGKFTVSVNKIGRPRKVLGWRTPAEVYADVIATAA